MANGTVAIPAQRRPDDELFVILEFVENNYDKHKRPGSPSWEVMKPRAEKHLRYLLNTTEEEL